MHSQCASKCIGRINHELGAATITEKDQKNHGFSNFAGQRTEITGAFLSIPVAQDGSPLQSLFSGGHCNDFIYKQRAKNVEE